jgi:hypothetical protein
MQAGGPAERLTLVIGETQWQQLPGVMPLLTEEGSTQRTLRNPNCRPGLVGWVCVSGEWRVISVDGRKEGGQPGNSNAMKHGFYSRKFKTIEINDLDVLEANNNLQDEILLLKVVIRRVWEMASTSAVDLDSWAMALGVLGMAMTRQAGLLRVQAMMGGGNSEITNAISQAIREVTDEFDRK